MLSKTDTQSFQEVLADLRATQIGGGLPLPTEILHGKNLVTKASSVVDIKAIRSLLQERQLKMMLAHDWTHRVKQARPLVLGERCYVIGAQDRWIDCFILGIGDCDRSYDMEVEATSANLRRN